MRTRTGKVAVTKGGRHLRTRSGFTLIEVLVALTIFAIGSVSVFVVFPASAMALRQAREYNDIALVLASQLDVVRATPFDQIEDKIITENLPSYVEKVEVDETVDPDLSDLKKIVLTVTYTSKGRERRTTVTTYAANF